VSLDAIGEALDAEGVGIVSNEEIEALIAALEDAGHQVRIDEEGSGVERLRKVLDATRVLKAQLGRTPTAQEISAQSGLTPFAVKHALALARVMRQ